MKNKLSIITTASLAISSLISHLPVYADDICDKDVPADVKKAAGCDVTTSIESVTVNVINAIILVIGIVAVVFIVYGGIQYILSSGDPGKTKKAKDTILYACIGLIVAALAYAIANFAIGIVNNSNS